MTPTKLLIGQGIIVLSIVVAGLCLLEREDVDLVAGEEGLDPVDPGPDGVDVPGGDAHAATLGGARSVDSSRNPAAP